MMEKLFLIILIFLCNAENIKAQNPCSGVFAGSIPHPDPRRCNEYYVCIFFIGSLQQCPPNQIFDGSSGNCIAGDPSTCLSTTTTSSTTPLTTTSLPAVTITTTSQIIQNTTLSTIGTTTTLPDINLDEICENVFFAARPHPHSIYLFVGCIRGDGTISSCLNGEYFNTNVMECVLIPTTTTTPTPCIVPDDICVGKQLEIIPNPCFCFRYIVCHIDTNIMEGECPLESIFDIVSKECRPGDWDTCDLYLEVSAPTTLVPSTTGFFNPCQNVLLGNRPMPGSCTMFYRCVASSPMPQQCSPGQIFDSNQLLCVDGDESDCLLITV